MKAVSAQYSWGDPEAGGSEEANLRLLQPSQPRRAVNGPSSVALPRGWDSSGPLVLGLYRPALANTKAGSQGHEELRKSCSNGCRDTWKELVAKLLPTYYLST